MDRRSGFTSNGNGLTIGSPKERNPRSGLPSCLTSHTDPFPRDTGSESPLPPTPGVVCGRIVGVFGIRGQIKVVSYTDPLEQLLGYRPWEIRTSRGDVFPVEPEGCQRQGQKLVVALAGFTDRTRSEALVGAEISVPRQCFPPLPKGQFYWVDLLGLEVVDEAGIRLGRVSDLTRGPAGDCLTVEGTPPLLIPFVWQSTVLAVELESRRIRIRSAGEGLPGAL